MSRAFTLLVMVVFATSNICAANDFIIGSKEDAENRLKARSLTYNSSYPGGDTTISLTTTVEQPTTAPSTTICMETTQTPCPTPSPCPTPTPCPTPPVNNLLYILPPFLSFVGFAAGVLTGAGCMRCHYRKAAGE